VFFWRRDTAEYVEQYGVTLPEAFLVHAAENAWTAPTISAEASLKAEWAIYRYYQQELDESLWPTEPGIDRST
jgi:hypothetical protein